MILKFKLMKITIVIVTALILLVGCAAYNQTSFSQYQGTSEFTGRGGTLKNIDGIDVWTTGEPNRRFQILGVIDQSHYNNNSVMSFVAGMSKDSELVATAKKQGGDAIIFIGADSIITGYKTSGWASGQSAGTVTSYPGGASFLGQSSSYGSTRTDANTRSSTRVAVIKYIQ